MTHFWRRWKTKIPIINEIDFDGITTAAYTEILNQKVDNLPVNPLKFKLLNSGVIISSLQRYCQLTHAPLNLATAGSFFEDGYMTKHIRPGIQLILYNAEKYNPRLRFTILHELAHIRLNHQKHGPVEEIEANFFASQLIAPNVLIREFRKRGQPVNQGCLMSLFFISAECADRKLGYLRRYPETHENRLDQAILRAFRKYLCCCVPVNFKYSLDIEMD